MPAKRYRYTGKERDDETGLGYHGARYYAAWLGRWERPDPIGLKGGINRFSYVRNRPTSLNDLTGTIDPEVAALRDEVNDEHYEGAGVTPDDSSWDSPPMADPAIG